MKNYFSLYFKLYVLLCSVEILAEYLIYDVCISSKYLQYSYIYIILVCLKQHLLFYNINDNSKKKQINFNMRLK